MSYLWMDDQADWAWVAWKIPGWCIMLPPKVTNLNTNRLCWCDRLRYRCVKTARLTDTDRCCVSAEWFTHRVRTITFAKSHATCYSTLKAVLGWFYGFNPLPRNYDKKFDQS